MEMICRQRKGSCGACWLVAGRAEGLCVISVDMLIRAPGMDDVIQGQHSLGEVGQGPTSHHKTRDKGRLFPRKSLSLCGD